MFKQRQRLLLLLLLLAASALIAQQGLAGAQALQAENGWIASGAAMTTQDGGVQIVTGTTTSVPDAGGTVPADSVLPDRIPAAPQIQGQELQLLALAGEHLAQGRPAEARSLYAFILHNSRSEEYRTEAAFQTALSLMLEGNYREAALLLQGILNSRPNLPRVRLELARAYFLNKDYEEARFQFELVKGGDLPAEVLEKVDAFLDRIRRQKDWSFDFDAALIPDSNISQSSGGSEECIATAFGLLCRPLEKKQSGIGLNLGGTFNHFWRFNRDFGLRSTIGLNILEHESRSYDDYQLYLASGPRWTFDSGESSLQPTFRKRWFAGRQYSEELGLRWDINTIVGSLLVNGGASFGQTSYEDDYIDSVLRGRNWSVFLRPRYILNDRTFVQAGLSFLRDKTEIPAYGSDSWRYSAGLYRVLPYGFSIFGELSLTRTRYHANQWYITRDYRIDESIRDDTTWQSFLSLSSNLLEKINLTPTLQYSYTKHNSNIWSREYDRHRINLLLNYRF